jgi:ABC-type proline/glycine betaine transport system permease subunit
MSRAVIRFWVYALPLPLFVVMYFVWAAWSDNRVFALYVMLLPLFYSKGLGWWAATTHTTALCTLPT